MPLALLTFINAYSQTMHHPLVRTKIKLEGVAYLSVPCVVVGFLYSAG